MSGDIPDHYQPLIKDWHRIDLPPDANPHFIAARCGVPPGSYFASHNAMWLETRDYVDAVKPLVAAEAIASPVVPLPEHAVPAAPVDSDS